MASTKIRCVHCLVGLKSASGVQPTCAEAVRWGQRCEPETLLGTATATLPVMDTKGDPDIIGPGSHDRPCSCPIHNDPKLPTAQRDAENESGDEEDFIQHRKDAICKHCGLNVWIDVGNGPIILRTCQSRERIPGRLNCIAGEPPAKHPDCDCGAVNPLDLHMNNCASRGPAPAPPREGPFLRKGYHGRVERDYYREVYVTTLKALIHERPGSADVQADKAARAAVEHYRKARGW